MTLLSIIRGVAVKVGVPKPTMVIGNPDQNVAQLLEMANEDCTSLAQMRPPWQAMVTEWTWTTINAEDQGPVSTVIGADFDRFVPGTIWDRSLIRPMSGPRSPQGWAQDHALVAAGPFYSFRIYDNHFWIFPVNVGHIITGEYVSKNWCQSALGTGQEQWLADTDTAKLDETMIKLKIIVTYKAQKGLPFQVDLSDYNDRLNDRISTDGGNPRVLNFNGRNDRYPAWPVLPDGNWPQ